MGSQTEYDIYAEDAVHLWLDNDGTVADLKKKVEATVVPALWNHFRSDLRPASVKNGETVGASLAHDGQ